MAKRPVFIAKPNKNLAYTTAIVEFAWFGGFARVQKEKCVRSLHEAYLANHEKERILEISSYSQEPLGVALSAFNLKIKGQNGHEFPVECIFQSGKIFKDGGPYKDLLHCSPGVAKKDLRLKTSGGLVSFSINGQKFPLEPKTFFYNWIYINALMENANLARRLLDYDAFTDIAFNPKASYNCQGEAAAVYVSLVKSKRINEALSNPDSFLKIVYGENGPLSGGKCDEAVLLSRDRNELMQETLF